MGNEPHLDWRIHCKSCKRVGYGYKPLTNFCYRCGAKGALTAVLVPRRAGRNSRN